MRRIHNYDYAASLYRAQSLRCEDTCTWALDRAEVKDWIDKAGPKNLWCHGIRKCTSGLGLVTTLFRKLMLIF